MRANRIVGLGLLAACAFQTIVSAEPGVSKGATGQGQYNVVLIIVDAMRPDHLGCYGYPKRTSPAIDALARKGVRCVNAFSQAGYTVASVMSILTSLYPKSHGVLRENSRGLSRQVYTLAEILKKYKYHNGWFTTLNEGALKSSLGYDRGVDTIGELSASLDGKEKVFDWVEANKDQRFFLALEVRKVHDPYFPAEPYRKAFLGGTKGKIFEAEREQEAFMHAFLSRVISDSPRTFTGQTVHGILRQRMVEAKEFFSRPYVPGELDRWIDSLPDATRVPLRNGLTREIYFEQIQAADQDNLKYLIGLYDGCILEVDTELIRPLVSLLQKLNISERTIVIITADHGEEFNDHQGLCHGEKYYDEVIHVPLIFTVPGIGPRTIRQCVQSIDIVPTLLDFLNIPAPHYIQGTSIKSIMSGEEADVKDPFIFGSHANASYIRNTQWKLIVEKRGLSRNMFLFRLTADPAETNNVLAAEAEMRETLERKLYQWDSSLPSYGIDQDRQPPVPSLPRKEYKGYW